MYLILVLSAITILSIKFINLRIPEPIFRIYRQPDKWYYIKFWLFYFFLKFRKNARDLKYNNVEPEKMDVELKYHNIIEKLQFTKRISYYPKAFDSVYFNASNSKGYHLIGEIALRPNGVVNGFLYVKIPGIGLLETIKLPDTMLFQDDEEKSLFLYGAEGLQFTPLKTMKTWKISYNGKMKINAHPKRICDVSMDLLWNSNTSIFDADWDVNPTLLANAYAKEPWSNEFFETLKNNRLNHYEQHGNMKGIMVVNGEKFKIRLNSLWSRIYGHNIQWKNIHRSGIHTMVLEDGTIITIGVVSIPVIFSSKEYGYVCKPNGELLPIKHCSFKLHEHGENGTPPMDYSFTVEAGGKVYQIQVDVLDLAEFYLGCHWELRVVECMTKFLVNGALGWGGVQWSYRHIGGRPSSISSRDPAWIKNMNE